VRYQRMVAITLAPKSHCGWIFEGELTPLLDNACRYTLILCKDDDLPRSMCVVLHQKDSGGS